MPTKIHDGERRDIVGPNPYNSILFPIITYMFHDDIGMQFVLLHIYQLHYVWMPLAHPQYLNFSLGVSGAYKY